MHGPAMTYAELDSELAPSGELNLVYSNSDTKLNPKNELKRGN